MKFSMFQTNPALRAIASTLICVLPLFSCNKTEIEEDPTPREPIVIGSISATVTLPDETRIIYSEVDDSGKASGLKSVWEAGDYFYAMNGGDKLVRFDLVSGAGKATATFLANCEDVPASTEWKAVLGCHATGTGAQINCLFDGQTGRLSDLGDFDYIVSTATGNHDLKFNFTSGTRLSYFMRIKLPAGIRYIEYCTACSYAVTQEANTIIYDENFDTVYEVDLGSESAEGAYCYLSIPAAAYTSALSIYAGNKNINRGAIFTFFNAARTKSGGKVISKDLREKGGSIGTFDVSGMTLYDRPLASDAIDFGSVSIQIKKITSATTFNNFGNYILNTTVSPQWAPFNLGANVTTPGVGKSGSAARKDLYGGVFCWGETSPRTTFASSSYSYGSGASFENTWLGVKENYGVFSPSSNGTVQFQRINGTKFDAARVQWGSEWRMPTPEEMMMFTGSCEGGSDAGTTTSTGFTSENIAFGKGTYYGLDCPGRKYTKSGKSIFFPHTGKYATGWSYEGNRGFYWSDSRLRRTPDNASLTNQPWIAHIQGGSVSFESGSNMYYGYAIRPVRNYPNSQSFSSHSPGLIEEGATAFHGSFINPGSNVYGWINDGTSGIAGVIVSDGYTCTKTDANGVYQLVTNSQARTVNVTVPAAYEIPMDSNGKPTFYQAYTYSSASQEISFALTARSAASNNFTIIFVADEHVNPSKVSTSQTRFASAMADVTTTATYLTTNNSLPVGSTTTAGNVIGISLGDQVWDNITSTSQVSSVLSTFRGVTGASSKKIPFFFVMGNHDNDNSNADTDYDAETSYVSQFGPTNYSFDIGNAHIIVMDDIIVTGAGSSTVSIKEGFTTDQVNWMKSDISNVADKSDKIAILCVHAPLALASAGDAGAQNAIMGQLKNNFKSVHVFSGHTHQMNNNYYKGWTALGGRNITEHTLQSLAGYWWLADISYDTGSPAGYGVYNFNADDLYAEYNKLPKENANVQFRVYNASNSYNTREDVGCSYITWINNEGSRGYKQFSWSGVGSAYAVRLWDANATNDSGDTWTVKLTSPSTVNFSRVSTAVTDAAAASYIFNTSGLGSAYGDARKETDQLWYGGSSFNSTFTIQATHTMPSGWSATYSVSNKYVQKKTYNGFPYGSSH